MTGSLALRRNIRGWRFGLALSVLIALCGGLFAASAPAQAAAGDVSANRGYCRGWNNPITTLLVHAVLASPSTSVDEIPDVALFVVDDEGVEWYINCPPAYAGLPVSVTPNGTLDPDIAVIEPSLTISIDGFADNQIPADGVPTRLRLTYDGLVQFTHAEGATPASTAVTNADLVRNPGALEGAANGVLLGLIQVQPQLGVVAPLALPPGTNSWGGVPQLGDPFLVPNSLYFPGFYVAPGSSGEFTVTARIDYDRNTNAANLGDHATVFARQTFTIIDPTVNNLSEASLSLFGAVDNPLTSADETRAGVDSAPAAGGEVWLKLDARNAAGERSTEARLQSISVFALGGTMNLFAPDARGAPTLPIFNQPAVASATLNAAAGVVRVLVPATLFIQLTKTDGQAGNLDVQAIVTGDDNTVNSETLTVTFTGPAATLSLGGDASVGQPAAGQTVQTEIALSGTDAAGNAVATPANVMYTITDADGNAVGASMIDAVNSTVGASTDTARDDNANAAAVLLTVSSSAAPGAYTLTASLPDVDDSSASATLTIAGPPANLSLTADKTSSTTIGDVITATATVTDADGAAVADGSEVTFTVTGSGLVAIGTDANPSASGSQSRTSGGDATARFTIIGGGPSVIVASVGGQSAVVAINSVGGAQAAPSLADCLSKQRGLASWTCEDHANASELFAELAADGVTALHLFNGDNWVFYALVDGRRVPGSTDFLILHSDILYIGR